MRIESTIVYDEFLYLGAPQYTNAELNDFLGRYDQIAIQAVVDQVSGPGILNVQIEHSADGRSFVGKGAAAIAMAGAGPGYGSFTTGTTTVLTGVDQGILPSLGFVRLKIFLVTATSAHVKIYVTVRDQMGAETAQSIAPDATAATTAPAAAATAPAVPSDVAKAIAMAQDLVKRASVYRR